MMMQLQTVGMHI